MTIVKLVFYLLSLVLVLFLAYYTTRLVGKSAGGKQMGKSIRVLERMGIGRDSWLLIVEIQEKVMLLGVSPAGIQKLEDLDGYEKRGREETEDGGDFFAILSKQMENGRGLLDRQKKDRGK